jgi:hypothetical protein
MASTGVLLNAQVPVKAKPEMTALRIDKPIELTGKLDNPAWKNAQAIEISYEVMPGENIPAPQKTYVKALYDDKYLYFGFQCFDTNPGQIRANISDRDKIFQDDFVGIMLDTYNDYQRAYELMVNPYGIKADLMRTGDNEDSSFDMIWNSAASINENGWTAEMAIPFTSINFPEKEESRWTLVVMRIIPRASRSQNAWTPFDRSIPSVLAQGGILTGIKNIKSGGNIELLPYIMGQKNVLLNNYDNPTSGMKYDPIIGRFGGSVKYSPSASFSLEAVLNPDFSQIESDAAQISVNTTFALQYDEKRPFFLNGRELLQTPVYYSRSINDPLWAGRIMGKSGGLTYMYMSAYDRNTIFIVPGEEMSSTVATDKKSLVNVGRLRYELGPERYIGAILLARSLDDAHNYDIGFDWGYRFWENWYFKGEIHLSQTKELNDLSLLDETRKFANTEYNAAFNGEQFTGFAMESMIQHNGRNYSFNLEYVGIAPTYQTYNGIITANDYKAVNMEHDLQFYPTNSFVDKYGFFVNTGMKYNYEGARKEWTVTPGLWADLKGQINVWAKGLLVNNEVFYDKHLTGVNRVQFGVNARPLNEIAFYFEAWLGNFIYRSSNPEVGYGHNITATLQLKPTSKIDISLSYTRANLANKETDALYFDGNIYRAVAIYQFSPEFFIRAIGQYNSFDGSFQLYPLFSYKMSAFTTFFAGVTSNYHNYEGEFGFRNTDQQFFVKVQYLLGI